MREQSRAWPLMGAAFLVCLTCAAARGARVEGDAPAPTAATQQTAAAEVARLERGERVRQVLAETCLNASQHDGNWPISLVVPQGSAVKLTYIRPGRILPTEYWKLSPTVILYESPEAHPEGVWVGYGDGHLEFAPDRAAFDGDLEQIEIARHVAAIQADHQAAAKAATTRPAATTNRRLGEMNLRVLSSRGQPVVGAMVGGFARWGDVFPGQSRVWFNDEAALWVPMSDREGRVKVPASTAFRYHPNAQSLSLVAIDERRGWVAILPVRRQDFDKPDVMHDVRLQQGCRVHGAISSVGLRAFNREVKRVICDVLFEAGDFSTWTISSDCAGPRFEMLLPPGDYALWIRGADCFNISHYLHIAPGQSEFNLRADLEPPYQVVQTFANRPAPEFRNLVAWKNSPPLKVSDLRGRVVLLDFWGYWCGFCVGNMPHLMEIYNELHAKGLEVIGIHDNSVRSLHELEQKRSSIREDEWKGRDLPFPVAIDGGNAPADSHGDFRGATTAAYGVKLFPTTLLIDRNGMIVEQLDLSNPHSRDEILNLLKSPEARAER